MKNMNASIKNTLQAICLSLLLIIVCAFFAMAGCNSNQKDTNSTPDNTDTTNTNDKTNTTNTTSAIDTKPDLMQSFNFAEINPDNIESIEVVSMNVGGREPKITTEHNEIADIYNYLNTYKVGDKTDKCVEDNTVIYNIKQNGKTYSINLEGGDILVFNKDRYQLLTK